MQIQHPTAAMIGRASTAQDDIGKWRDVLELSGRWNDVECAVHRRTHEAGQAIHDGRSACETPGGGHRGRLDRVPRISQKFKSPEGDYQGATSRCGELVSYYKGESEAGR